MTFHVLQTIFSDDHTFETKVENKAHNSVNKITKLEVHKTCDKIGITPPENGNRNGFDL